MDPVRLLKRLYQSFILVFSDLIPVCFLWFGRIQAENLYHTFSLIVETKVSFVKEQKCCCCWTVVLWMAAGTLAVQHSLAGLGLTGFVGGGKELDCAAFSERFPRCFLFEKN